MKPLLAIIFQVKPVHIRDPKDVHACTLYQTLIHGHYIYTCIAIIYSLVCLKFLFSVVNF